MKVQGTPSNQPEFQHEHSLEFFMDENFVLFVSKTRISVSSPHVDTKRLIQDIQQFLSKINDTVKLQDVRGKQFGYIDAYSEKALVMPKQDKKVAKIHGVREIVVAKVSGSKMTEFDAELDGLIDERLETIKAQKNGGDPRQDTDTRRPAQTKQRQKHDPAEQPKKKQKAKMPPIQSLAEKQQEDYIENKDLIQDRKFQDGLDAIDETQERLKKEWTDPSHWEKRI